jgi:hypothetical protein
MPDRPTRALTDDAAASRRRCGVWWRAMREGVPGQELTSARLASFGRCRPAADSVAFDCERLRSSFCYEDLRVGQVKPCFSMSSRHSFTLKLTWSVPLATSKDGP